MSEPLKIQPGNDVPDKETQEIIDSMRKDGIAPPHEAAAGIEPNPTNQGDQKTEEVIPPKEPDQKGEDRKQDDKNKQVDIPPDRTPRFIPYSRHKEILDKEREKWTSDEIAKLSKEVERLSSQIDTRPDTQKGDAEKDADVKKFAETHNLEESVVVDLLGLVEKRLPKQEKDPGLEAFKEKQEEERQEAVFQRDFNTNVVPLIKAEHPNYTPDEIEKIKDKIFELAFSDELLKTPITRIYKSEDEFRAPAPSPSRRSSEPSKGGSQQQMKQVDYDNITAEDISQMSDDEFDKYSEEMGRRHRSPIRRGGRPVANR